MIAKSFLLTALPVLLFLEEINPSLGFVSHHSSINHNHRYSFLKMAAEKPSGSFFHSIPEGDGDAKVPDPSNDSAMDDTIDPFDDSLSKLMDTRRAKPRASSPSTIDGIPTSKVAGFAKPPTQKITTPKPYIPIGPPLNDINNPEFDDQGYTLYADEETGEKKRVFEALVEYPCNFKIKIVGENEGTFVTEMVQVVADSCKASVGDIDYSERKNGKWISVTVNAPVQSAEMLYRLYEDVDRDPRVKFKF